MQGILIEDLKFLGDTEKCKDILRGEYKLPKDLDLYTVAYIKELKKLDLITNTPKAIILAEIFKQGQRQMKEHTSARILGIYFGYLKVCALEDELVDFEATICYIPYATDYSPQEWRQGINAIIEKKGKGNWVQNLRMINLIEADFNYSNKVIAKEIL